MASRWAEDLPAATIAYTSHPKPITLIYPYYNNLRFFQQQLELWNSYAPDLQDALRVIVIDDGSPAPAAHPGPLPYRFRLFRIEVDVRWNWLAARNLGAQTAADGWLLLTDMDHQVPERTFGNLVYGIHDPAVVYAFQRREHSGAVVAPHSASFFLTRRRFWQSGGYDEALSGYYGTDGEFRRRLQRGGPTQIIPDPLIRFERIGDSSTTRYGRKEPQDARVRQLVAARPPDWRPRVLSFPYHEVTA